MASSRKYTGAYESLPRIVKIIIQIFLGAFVGAFYRIFRSFETKNVNTLIVGIWALLPVLDVVFWVVDIITEITSNRITFLVDIGRRVEKGNSEK